MASIPFMPDRLNAEPVVFRGFTTPEMFWTAGIALVGGLVVGLIPDLLFGWVYIPTVALLMPLVVLFFGGKLLTRYKRGKPENFLYRRLEIRLARLGWGGKNLVLDSRRWRLRRSKPVLRHGEITL